MPMLALRCPLCGTTEDQYLPSWRWYGCGEPRLCPHCASTMGPALSVGRGLTYFEEGRARTIQNLGGVTITSHEQHKRVMKERGVEMATDWHTSKKGIDWAHHAAPKPAPVPSLADAIAKAGRQF